MEQTSIGERILKRRKELGQTQTQIKEITGISTGNLSDIENGKKLPSAPTLLLLSKVLNCSIDWIVTGSSYNSIKENLTNERERELLDLFRELSPNDQDEIIEIINIKQRLQNKRMANPKSLPSTGLNAG